MTEIVIKRDTKFEIGLRKCRTILLDVDGYPFKVMVEERESEARVFDTQIYRGLENGKYERCSTATYSKKEEDEVVENLERRCVNIIVPFDLEKLEKLRWARRKFMQKRRGRKTKDEDYGDDDS